MIILKIHREAVVALDNRLKEARKLADDQALYFAGYYKKINRLIFYQMEMFIFIRVKIYKPILP